MLNGDSGLAKETKAGDSESTAANAENGNENAVTGKPAVETCSAGASAKSKDKKHSADNVATSKVAESQESGADEKPASTPADSEAASDSADVKSAAVEESTEVEKPEKSAEKAADLFTDDMVKKIEQNYSPTEAGALNLLDIADDEMLASEAAAEMNGAAETNGTEPTDGVEGAAKTDEKLELAEAANLFLQGKRNMLVKDYESAANILGDACGKYSAIYGDLGVECAEVYMAYGQALLEWWRVEDSNRKSNDTVGEEEGDEPPAKENGVDAPQTEKAAGVPMETDHNDESNADNAEETIDETRTEDQAENGDESEDEIESEEDVDNLQIAFEILEVAKKIYERRKDNANLAKVHSKLGEISIASGNLTYALEDLQRALELLTQSTAVDVRHKANVHFQLYIAHTMRCSFPEAEAELRLAKSTFESHLRDLESRLQKASKSSERDTITAEIKEIKDVVGDVSEKLAECQKEKRQLISAISDVIKTKHPAASADMPSSSSASVDAPSTKAASTFSPLKANVPINNISHLVRKKPKNLPEEAKTEAKNEAEKTGQASAAADAKSNGVETSKDSIEAADGNAKSASKRKAEDVLENETKKACT